MPLLRLLCAYSRHCPSCGSDTVTFRGAGTQKAEEQLQELLPEARILRVDTDSVAAKYSLEKKLDQFAKGEYDVMVGTQMVAKGLDFENVTLVGVLSADQSLYSDDFRSNERTFDLLTQVVGRAGRGKYRDEPSSRRTRRRTRCFTWRPGRITLAFTARRFSSARRCSTRPLSIFW